MVLRLAMLVDTDLPINSAKMGGMVPENVF
jgi:hypothetical protein